MVDATDLLLANVEVRSEQENRRMLANLVAWADILDALGWKVALAIPSCGVFLNARAKQWAERVLTTSEISWGG